MPPLSAPAGEKSPKKAEETSEETNAAAAALKKSVTPSTLPSVAARAETKMTRERTPKLILLKRLPRPIGGQIKWQGMCGRRSCEVCVL
ncbi:hypothetical protein CUR178_05899 [Leishmania enriettii]|uniref:Uncharacterized protein n=1 Tax=Leishmania enriettii TaxID=5663 RepID=A0A836GV76_LEIEN|nr:hypothetical protein CUR178_05899 [Leishmania enriettii]